MTGLEIFLAIIIAIWIVGFISTFVFLEYEYPLMPWTIWEEYKHKINWFGLVLISIVELIVIPFIYIPGVIICGLIKLGTRR